MAGESQTDELELLTCVQISSLFCRVTSRSPVRWHWKRVQCLKLFISIWQSTARYEQQDSPFVGQHYQSGANVRGNHFFKTPASSVICKTRCLERNSDAETERVKLPDRDHGNNKSTHNVPETLLETSYCSTPFCSVTGARPRVYKLYEHRQCRGACPTDPLSCGIQTTHSGAFWVSSLCSYPRLGIGGPAISRPSPSFFG